MNDRIIMVIMLERESKFSLSRAQYYEIKDYFSSKKRYRKFSVIKIDEQTLESKYYDTRESNLMKEDASLRIRKSEDLFYVSFKKKKPSSKNVNVMEENELLLRNEPKIDDMKLEPLSLARQIAGERELMNIANLKIQRSLFYFKQDEILFEMSLDAVHVSSPRDHDFFELEIELKKGAIKSLEEFARNIAADFALIMNNSTKIEKALDIKEEEE